MDNTIKNKTPTSNSHPTSSQTKEVDFTSILATASGSGMLGGSLLGISGALLGSVIGAGFGYWAQVNSKSHQTAKGV